MGFDIILIFEVRIAFLCLGLIVARMHFQLL
jgi:hypothetical protein